MYKFLRIISVLKVTIVVAFPFTNLKRWPATSDAWSAGTRGRGDDKGTLLHPGGRPHGREPGRGWRGPSPLSLQLRGLPLYKLAEKIRLRKRNTGKYNWINNKFFSKDVFISDTCRKKYVLINVFKKN